MPAPVDPEPSAKVHPSMSNRHARMAPPPRKLLAELPADCFEGKNEKRSKQPREKTHWQMKRNSSAVKYLGGHHDPQTEKREQKEKAVIQKVEPLTLLSRKAVLAMQLMTPPKKGKQDLYVPSCTGRTSIINSQR